MQDQAEQILQGGREVTPLVYSTLQCLNPAKHNQKQLAHLREYLCLGKMRKTRSYCTLSPSVLGSTQRMEQDQCP